MCDTIVIVEKDRVLFAKNSDRDPNEGQNLEWHPARTNPSDASLRCTYIEIPDIPRVFATMISRPFWMWGAEMGTNECGVTIGNEAVFTTEPYEETPGLIGMDLVRLALERSDSATFACECIIELLELYGQGGGCGHESKKVVYHNSFIVADKSSAFVLETAGRKLAVERVEGARTISNGLTIPSFASSFADVEQGDRNGCALRRARSQTLANSATTTRDLMAILGDHGDGNEHPHYDEMNGGLSAPCVHAGGRKVNAQTTGSWVSELSPDSTSHWATGTTAPCISLFKPVAMEKPVGLGATAKDSVNESYWWQHERLHRLVTRDPARLRPLFIAERDAIQDRWCDNPPDSQSAFDESSVLMARWLEKVQSEIGKAEAKLADQRPIWTQEYWEKRNARCGLAL